MSGEEPITVTDAELLAAFNELLEEYRAKRQWRKWVRDLRSAHPPKLPVRVRRRMLKDYNGHARLSADGSHFTVTIDATLDNQHAWSVLLHEWAHLLTWWDEPTEVDHNDAWGKCFAMLWRENHGDADHEVPE